ncbi:MAG: hypothetical protein RL514_1145 [Verrucomicrobiota bacterium]|jgi:FkbM family methyltransferase
MIPTNLRRLVRKTGLQQLAQPLVAAVERVKLARICNYSVSLETPPEQACYRWRGGELLLATPNEQFRGMAMSEHERPTTAVFLRHVRPGMVVWDIGANVGFYSCMLSRLVGESGVVIAVEPNLQNIAALAENQRLSKSANIRALQCALSDHDGEVVMVEDPGYSSINRVLEGQAQPQQGTITMQASRGDSLVEVGKIPAPIFIKIDVEGHELSVINGLTRVLERRECRGVLVEVHFGLLDQAGLAGAPDLIQRGLRNAGFRSLSWVSRSHLLALKP